VQAPSLSDQKILGFHSEDSLHSQNNAFNKAIAKHNQLRLTLKGKTLDYTCDADAAPTYIMLLRKPKTPRKFLNST
jgi:hypothetical protein